MQCLDRQDDLPQSCRANALAQGGFARVNHGIWTELPKRLAFCLIDKRPIRTRNNKIDFFYPALNSSAIFIAARPTAPSPTSVYVAPVTPRMAARWLAGALNTVSGNSSGLAACAPVVTISR